MIDVVGVTFNNQGQVYYFSPGSLKLKTGQTVIVNTEYGFQLGTVYSVDIHLEECQIKGNLKEVVRVATKKDYNIYLNNIKDAEDALKKSKELVIEHKLKMKMIDASYTFEREKLVFHFLADNRVDFRNLAKELASIYKTRIELRQIGVRDKAKKIGGCGPCGREFCCKSFLKELDTVGIGMAKNQNIALNPTKINGVCGRLLCCLKYEDELYSDLKKKLPKVGDIVQTEFGKGKVISIDIINQVYKVNIESKGVFEIAK